MLSAHRRHTDGARDGEEAAQGNLLRPVHGVVECELVLVAVAVLRAELPIARVADRKVTVQGPAYRLAFVKNVDVAIPRWRVPADGVCAAGRDDLAWRRG